MRIKIHAETKGASHPCCTRCRRTPQPLRAKTGKLKTWKGQRDAAATPKRNEPSIDATQKEKQVEVFRCAKDDEVMMSASPQALVQACEARSEDQGDDPEDGVHTRDGETI